MTKTNAVRALDRSGIAYQLRACEIDEADLSAERAAAKLGMAPEAVFKTLSLRQHCTLHFCRRLKTRPCKSCN
jgi:Cys-tRNA(Pro)/Cys-tRNA(Cys) deacylase